MTVTLVDLDRITWTVTKAEALEICKDPTRARKVMDALTTTQSYRISYAVPWTNIDRKEGEHTGALKIKCYRCRGTYRLYGDMVHHPDANHCPFCHAEIRRSVWDRIVIPAFGTIEDANRDLHNEHTGYMDTPLFQIEYQAHKPQPVKRHRAAAE